MIIKSVEGVATDVQALFPNPMLVLRGITAAETAGSASTAEFVLRHGTNATAPITFAPANFAADGFMPPVFWPDPVPCPNGIYLDVASGVLTVVIYYDLE